MADFQVVRRRRKHGRKDKNDKSLTERIAEIKNDLRLTDFYEKSVIALNSSILVNSNRSNGLTNQDVLDSGVLAGSDSTGKEGISTKCVNWLVTADKVGQGLNKMYIAKSEKVDFKLEKNIESAGDKSHAHSTVEKNCNIKHYHTLQEIVCYGLGNFSVSYIAKYQLAFLLLITEELDVPISDCHLFDPKFNKEEKLTLQTLGLSIIQENEVGKRKCNRKTLFYMPHCGKALYNNLLWTNWGLGLEELVIIGNSFSRMVDNTPKRILDKTGHYILKVQPYVTETELPVTDKFEDVFNDTVIHTFNELKTKIQEEFWEDILEPEYETGDPEIIF